MLRLKHKKRKDLTVGLDTADPCPFCAEHTDLILDYWTTEDSEVCRSWIECGSCDASGPDADDPKGAVEAWNRRDL